MLESSSSDNIPSIPPIVTGLIPASPPTSNLTCSLELLYKLFMYFNLYNNIFIFIYNKPNLVKYLRNVYCSGYKIIYENKQFIIKINYEFLNNEY